MSETQLTRTLRVLAFAALGLGVLAAVAGTPDLPANGRVDVHLLARNVAAEEDHVTALELAQWIKEKRDGLRVVDIRSAAEFASYHVPTAERIPLETLVETPFRRDETIVLYSEGGTHAAQGWVFLRALGYQHVYFLRDGLYEWLDQVMNPTISEASDDSLRANFERVASLSRYFGGVPRVGPPSAVEPTISIPVKGDSSSAVAGSIVRLRGRGC